MSELLIQSTQVPYVTPYLRRTYAARSAVSAPPVTQVTTKPKSPVQAKKRPVTCAHPGCTETFIPIRKTAKFCLPHRTDQAAQQRHLLRLLEAGCLTCEGKATLLRGRKALCDGCDAREAKTRLLGKRFKTATAAAPHGYAKMTDEQLADLSEHDLEAIATAMLFAKIDPEYTVVGVDAGVDGMDDVIFSVTPTGQIDTGRRDANDDPITFMHPSLIETRETMLPS